MVRLWVFGLHLLPTKAAPAAKLHFRPPGTSFRSASLSRKRFWDCRLVVAEDQVAGLAHHLGADDPNSFSTDQALVLGVWGEVLQPQGHGGKQVLPTSLAGAVLTRRKHLGYA